MALNKGPRGLTPEMMAQMQAMGGGDAPGPKKRYRFVDPSQRPNAGKPGSMVYAPKDPLQDVMTKKGKPTDTLDVADWRTGIRNTSAFNPAFMPFHEVLSHPRWSEHDKSTALKMLIDHGTSPDLVMGTSIVTPLQRALELRQTACARVLISNGANLNLRDQKGNTPLMNAFSTGQLDLVLPMLRMGAKGEKTSLGLNVVDLAISRYQLTQNEEELHNSLSLIKKFKIVDHDGVTPWINDEQTALLLSGSNADNIEEKNTKRMRMRKLLEGVNKIPGDGRVNRLSTERYHTNPKKHIEDEEMYTVSKPGFFMSLFGAGPSLEATEGVNELTFALKRLNETRASFELLRLTSAIKNGQSTVPSLQSFLKLGATVNLENAKTHPEGDTLLLHAVRTNNSSVLDMAINQGFNLNARDARGDSALHLLTSQFLKGPNDNHSRDAFIEQMAKLVGVPGGEHRQALNPHGFYADWYLTNAQGQTFLDILQEQRPEWAAQVSQSLGIPNENVDTPTLPQLIAYTPPPSLMPDDIPVVSPLSSTATTSDEIQKSVELQEMLHRVYTQMSTETNSEIVHQFRNKVEQSLSNVSPRIKVLSLFNMAAHVEQEGNSASPKAVSGLASHLATLAEKGTPEEKAEVFNSFDDVLSKYDAQGGDLRYLYSTITQLGVLTSNPEYMSIGNKLEASLSRMAEAKFGTVYDDESSQPPQGIQRG